MLLWVSKFIFTQTSKSWTYKISRVTENNLEKKYCGMMNYNLQHPFVVS